MGFKHAKKIYRQTEEIIRSKVHPVQNKGANRKIDYRAELESLPECSKKIEWLTYDLLKRNQKNPALSPWTVDLYVLAEYYLTELWRINSKPPREICQVTGFKYYYYLKCHHYLYSYKSFLRKQIYQQNFLSERLFIPQYPLAPALGIKTSNAHSEGMPNKNGNTIQIPAGYVRKDPKKVSIPKAMAILDCLGVRSHPKFIDLPQEKKWELYQMLLGGNFRTLEGNHKVLDHFSNEDRFRYTSHKHRDWARSLFEQNN